MGRVGAASLVLLCVLAGSAVAQTPPGPPGPYVIDLRGALIGVPGAGAFFPAATPEGVSLKSVPSRAFGFDVGGHVYPGSVGAARLGVGVNLIRARASISAPDVSAVVTTVAPQVSFNFGSADGWSYLGGGYGVAMVTSHVAAANTDADSGRVGAINVGGGVRWFLRPRLGAGFDVRFHRLGKGARGPTPAGRVLSFAVGISVR